ncbi:hypothetical protein CLU79DRAFT_710465 [Phycomyces nitens]|nr:hypothetical protein CLU79DRAFT_710465 [Phycomyces nitens]
MADSLYSQRSEWADITPIPQDDGPNPLVPIAYSADYIIEMNPAHYTVWQYRQQVLFSIGSNLDKELDYMDSIAESQSKNYQIWHHRQVIVDRLGNGDRELDFINNILESDSKNYHAWSYRQWVVTHFDKWDEELSFIDDMLVFDIRNNSAWNYRYFVLTNRPHKPTLKQLEDEIEILEKAEKPLREMKEFLDSLREKEITSPHLWSMYIDMYEQNAIQDKKPIDPAAIEMCTRLADTFDTIRQTYWDYKKSKLVLL